MRRPPPLKRADQAKGPRRLNGAVLDVTTFATELGDTDKGVRAKAARGFLPYRRLGGRIVFIRSEVEEFLRKLPGVSVDEALENLKARESGR